MKAGVSQSRVLVVDDEPGICSLLRDLLTSEGHAVRTAANGRQALAMLDDFQPHLVVVDVRMPLMDGYEFLRHLRAKSDLPAIVISGYAELREVIAAGAGGAEADAYFPKSIPWQEFRESVRYLLAAARNSAPSSLSKDEGR